MIATIQLIERYEDYEKVAFFTLQLETRTRDEFSDFNHRMKEKLKNVDELGEMLLLIENMGTKWGAQKKYFKDESGADRFVLPLEVWTDDNSQFGLRLYCIRLTPQVVIILNGDTKTKLNPLECPNCRKYFEFARRAAKAIDRAIVEGFIEIKDFDIEIDEDFELSL